MSKPAPTTRRARSARASLPAKAATGATSASTTVAEVICPAAPRRAIAGQHQTHGAVTPIQGGITSVNQLTNNGRSILKGSPDSFQTLAAYTSYLNTLDLHTLRRHASENKQVPIDDRPRLIRRLESQWTATAARAGRGHIPARVPFTQAQIDAQNEVRNKLLRVS